MAARRQAAHAYKVASKHSRESAAARAIRVLASRAADNTSGTSGRVHQLGAMCAFRATYRTRSAAATRTIRTPERRSNSPIRLSHPLLASPLLPPPCSLLKGARGKGGEGGDGEATDTRVPKGSRI